jgi:cell wall-associated NlpC family hydrolase
VSGRLRPAEIVETALSLTGVPYRNGGTDLSGFDCSGLVAYVFSRNRFSVPRTVAEQYALGRRVGRTGLEAGDLVFFSTEGPAVSHVGIVVAPDEFLHAPASNGVVRVERLSSPYWSSRFAGARRLH